MAITQKTYSWMMRLRCDDSRSKFNKRVDIGGGDLVLRYDKRWGKRVGKLEIMEGKSWPGNKEVLTPGEAKKKVSRDGCP